MVTLLVAARALADQIGGWGMFKVTRAPEAADPDARRTLISDELVDEDRDPTAFNDYVAYAAGGALGGEQVAVRREGYDGASGILYTSGLFSLVPRVGQEIEYHARLARRRHLGEPGLREVLNEALDRLWFEERLPVVTGTGVRVACPTWISSDRQLGPVLATSDPSAAAYGTGQMASLVHDGSGRWIELSSPVSGASALVVRRPHGSWIRAGGTWADSSAGLVDDDDETMADLEPLLVVATWRAYRALNRRSPDFEQGPWKDEERRAEVKATAYLQWGAGSTVSPIGPVAGPPGSWSKGWRPG
ncbi:MAG TPA: hypothetical protein VIL10_05345 [Marmoricola sp.]